MEEMWRKIRNLYVDAAIFVNNNKIESVSSATFIVGFILGFGAYIVWIKE
jgi:hypothetical protein